MVGQVKGHRQVCCKVPGHCQKQLAQTLFVCGQIKTHQLNRVIEQTWAEPSRCPVEKEALGSGESVCLFVARETTVGQLSVQIVVVLKLKRCVAT